jgi:hypothetical protein
VVSCLHRHASLDSMREVETVQPLASPPTSAGHFILPVTSTQTSE